MRERPIIFNSEMVRAVMEGRKVQTRRIMKVQPSEEFSPMNMALETDFTAHWYTPGVVDKDGYLQPAKKQVFGVASEDEGYTCPFGAVGDRLWVRETWSDVDLDGAPAVAYRADDGVYDLMDDESFLDEDGAFNYQDPRVSKYHFAAWYSVLISGVEGNWRPSIHMPRWASRITLEIIGVRVERLQDISEGDAKAEGLAEITKDGSLFKFGIPDRDGYPGNDNNGWPWTEWECNPVDAYHKLWKSIYGDESWQANPWVWVIEFKRVEGE